LGPSGAELVLWDGVHERQFAGPRRFGVRVEYRYWQINNAGHVAWAERLGDPLFQVYLWDGVSARLLTERAQGIDSLDLNDAGQVVWNAQTEEGPAIFFWNGAEVQRLTHDANHYRSPKLNNRGQIVWSTELRAFEATPRVIDLWTRGTVRRLTDPYQLVNSGNPEINDAGQVVWAASDGRFGGYYNDDEIYLWTGSNIQRLSDNNFPDVAPRLNNAGQVVWTGFPANLSIGPVQKAISFYTPARVRSLTLAGPSVLGGQPTAGVVTLSEPAPQGGAVITLTSADPRRASVPATVSVAGGATTAHFAVQTAGVGDTATVLITATYAGSSGTEALTVLRRGPNLGIPARP
jgi:hypothetical protein